MNKTYLINFAKSIIINYLVPGSLLFYEQLRSLGINLPLPVFRKRPNIKDATRIRNVRIILNKGIKEVALMVRGLYGIYDESTNQCLDSGASGFMTVSASCLRGLSIKGDRSSLTFATTTVGLVSNSPIYVGGHLYRGKIVIRRTGDSLQLINILGVENYLMGVVPAEMAPDAPLEALKAQAVASRSFVSCQILMEQQFYDVDSTVMSQLYKGVTVESTASSEAIRDTVGEIVAYGYQPAETLFHSSCGGTTEHSKNVWGIARPYLISVECPCQSNGSANQWHLEIKKKELIDLVKNLSVQGAQIQDIKLNSESQSCRVNSLGLVTEQGTFDVSLDSLRHSIGVHRLRSGRISLTTTKDSFIFEGTGWGHGIGMCQMGAIELAKRGFTYKQILKKYYPGTRIFKVSYSKNVSGVSNMSRLTKEH